MFQSRKRNNRSRTEIYAKLVGGAKVEKDLMVNREKKSVIFSLLYIN